MKLLLRTVLVLICAAPMAAQAELTLRLATPGDNPVSDPIDAIEITASQIDAAVGTNFFSTQANLLVSDLATMRQDLIVDIRNAILANNQVQSVESVIVLTNPISVRLTQLTSAIGVHAAGIHADLQVTTDGIPIICPSVHITAVVDSTADGTFNFITGLIDNLNANNNVDITSASCSGLFGFVGNILAQIFVGGVDNLVESKIENRLQDLMGFDDMQTMFGLSDLTQDLTQAVPPGPVKDKVLDVVDDFLFLLAQNRGLQLDILIDPDFHGPTGPLLSLTASQQAPSVTADNTQTETIISVNAPGADLYDIYSIQLLMASTSATIFTIPRQPPGAEILAVAHSALIPGLKSFPGQTLVQENFACGPSGCVFIP